MTKHHLKEGGVKNLMLIMLALFLVVPVLSNAAGVSSRYDVTFGGFIKYDLGYSTQNIHADPTTSFRDRSFNDEYSNTFATGAETRFNFLIKGPDLWGAKTRAFIEGDFRGTTTGNAYGGFQLRHAFMILNWQNAELMIGQNWQQWGMTYYPAMIGIGEMPQYMKGIRTPQVAYRYFFTKEFNAMAGITSATTWSGATRGYNDDYARSGWPGLMGEIAYWSDRCGKIGPNNMKFAVGGVYGKESKTFTKNGEFEDDTIDAWLTAFRYSIPIVPEKQGNKAMALFLNGNFFYGQNVAGNNWFGPGNPSPSNGSYWRNNVVGSDAVAPSVYGLYAQASFWLTNNLWINGIYGHLNYNYSSRARELNPNLVQNMQTYAANILWDVNQAIRFGFQWMRMYTRYNAEYQGLGKTGILDQYRAAAWYFF